MAFTYNSNVLSSFKFSPPMASASLSATGVVYLTGANVQVGVANVVLETADPTVQGVAFNSLRILDSPAVNLSTDLVSFALNNTTVRVPKALHNTSMALILAPVSNLQNYVTFTYLSGAGTSFVSLCAITNQVVTADTKRKRHLGMR